MRTSKRLLTAISVLFLSACPDGSGTTGTNPDGGGGMVETDAGDQQIDSGPDDEIEPGTLDGRCAAAVRVGGFELREVETFTSVAGQVADGVLPVTVREVVDTQGSCTLFKRNNPFCATPCAANETCDHDGSCIPFPLNQDVGDVSLRGIAMDVTMDLQPPGNTYFDSQLSHPAFADEDVISLSATGGDTEEFSLDGRGVAPLVVTTESIDIVDGQSFDVEWSASSSEDVVVHFALTIDQHGNSPLALECTWADSGVATVSASLISQLVQAGVTGFPRADLIRQTEDSATTSLGCVEFLVQSPRNIDEITVAGHTPCNVSAECPDGQMCNVALNTCE